MFSEVFDDNIGAVSKFIIIIINSSGGGGGSNSSSCDEA